MHPTEILSQEHRAIEARMDELERQVAAARAGGPFPRRFLDEALDFFRYFADGCHHAKEENLLFPLMRERGVAAQGGPIGVMLAEHEQGRACLKDLRENLDAAERGSIEARERVFASAEAYIELLRQHIYKEDNILFRMARMVLRPEDVASLQQQFAAVEVPERFLECAANSNYPRA